MHVRRRPRRGFLTAVAICLSAVLLHIAPRSADGFVFTTAESRCRDAVGRSAAKLARSAQKATSLCHRSRSSGRIAASTDCNDIAVADDKNKVARAQSKLGTKVNRLCAALSPSDVGYPSSCPPPCDSQVPTVTNSNELAECMGCLAADAVSALGTSAQGHPAVPLASAEQDCHKAIGSRQGKHFSKALSERTRCQRKAERTGSIDTGNCVGKDPTGKITSTRLKASTFIQSRCAASNLTALDSCSDVDAVSIADCVLDESDQTTDVLVDVFYPSFGGPTTTTTTTTTTTLPPQDPACPEFSNLTVVGHVTGDCSTNVDCIVGTCDPGLGACRTETELDTGWTGIAHDSDVTDGVITRSVLRCGGPFDGGSAEPCGTCFVTGLDPSTRSCRCENDTRTTCDEPFQADIDDCGGATCDCYLGGPLPISSGNTPVCVLNGFREDISGTTNVDTGEGSVELRLAAVVYLGIDLTHPCPHCEGDVTVGDGVRDGVCVGGENDGLACDSEAVNRTFPAPGGGGHSLDCFPSSNKNISGNGLQITFTQTTGTADEIDADLSCFFGYEVCHCMVCSGDNTIACDSDGVCADAGAGTCSQFGSAGANTREDGCKPDSSGFCVPSGAGDGEGMCDSGPDDTFCDAITRGDGEGFIACNNNTDCAPGTIGIDGGNCTLAKRRECFLSTITATGVPDPFAPISVGSFCIPPTSNGGINAVAGLPGPGRLRNQGLVTTFCSSDPNTPYTPGSGGCP